MRRTRHLLLSVVLLALLALTPAHAQDATVTGTIDATVDGEPLRWTTLTFTADGEVTNTAELEDYGFLVHVTLQGHVEPRYLLRQALVLSADLFGGLGACPCAGSEPELFYFVAGSMFANGHKADEGTFVVETALPLEDGRWHLTGRFAFDAPFFADLLFGEPDLDRVLRIEGTFDVEAAPLSRD